MIDAERLSKCSYARFYQLMYVPRFIGDDMIHSDIVKPDRVWLILSAGISSNIGYGVYYRLDFCSYVTDIGHWRYALKVNQIPQQATPVLSLDRCAEMMPGEWLSAHCAPSPPDLQMAMNIRMIEVKASEWFGPNLTFAPPFYSLPEVRNPVNLARARPGTPLRRLDMSEEKVAVDQDQNKEITANLVNSETELSKTINTAIQLFNIDQDAGIRFAIDKDLHTVFGLGKDENRDVSLKEVGECLSQLSQTLKAVSVETNEPSAEYLKRKAVGACSPLSANMLVGGGVLAEDLMGDSPVAGANMDRWQKSAVPLGSFGRSSLAHSADSDIFGSGLVAKRIITILEKWLDLVEKRPFRMLALRSLEVTLGKLASLLGVDITLRDVNGNPNAAAARAAIDDLKEIQNLVNTME